MLPLGDGAWGTAVQEDGAQLKVRVIVQSVIRVGVEELVEEAVLLGGPACRLLGVLLLVARRLGVLHAVAFCGGVLDLEECQEREHRLARCLELGDDLPCARAHQEAEHEACGKES